MRNHRERMNDLVKRKLATRANIKKHIPVT